MLAAAYVVDVMMRLHFRRERVLRDRRNAFELPDDHFLLMYRLPKDAVFFLCDELRPYLSPRGTNPRALSVEEKVLIALRYFGLGGYQAAIVDGSDHHPFSQATVSHALDQVVNALLQGMTKLVAFPMEEVEKTKAGFKETCGLPNIVGAIDTTHVQIRAPSVNPHAYVNKMSTHSINVQLICNAKRQILSVVAKWPGSCSNSYVWDQSRIKHNFESGVIKPRSALLGDKGYPLQPYILTPVRNPTTAKEYRYNQRHKKGHQFISHAIGELKSRFRCIDLSKGQLEYDPSKACKIIVSCCILHNVCKEWGIVQEKDEDV